MNKDAMCGWPPFASRSHLSPWHWDLDAQTIWLDLSPLWKLAPHPNLQGEAAPGEPELLGVASLLRLRDYFLSDWEKKNIPGFLFASVLRHPWLLGLFNWLETMAGTVSPRVKSLSWACVSFWSRTHFLPASLPSCPHLGFVTNLA